MQKMTKTTKITAYMCLYTIYTHSISIMETLMGET